MDTLCSLLPLILTEIFIISFISLSIYMHKDLGFSVILVVFALFISCLLTALSLVLIILTGIAIETIDFPIILEADKESFRTLSALFS